MKRIFAILFHFLLWAITAQSQIEEAEVFFNQDPGMGKGISIRIEQGDLINTLTGVAAEILTPGSHRLFMRIRENNIWSHTAYVGVLQVTDVESPFLYQIEYFFNEYVPGPLVYTHLYEAADQLSSEFNIPVRGLLPGRNQLYYRVSDGKRKSHFVAHSFIVNQPETSYTAGEFFVDSEPGQGNANPISVGVSNTVDDVFVLNPGSLNPGKHMLHFRLKNQSRWSHYGAIPFTVSFNRDQLPSLTRLLYKVNDFRELDDWMPVELHDAEEMIDDVFEVAARDLDLGENLLFLKIDDRAGRRSHYVELKFDVHESINPVSTTFSDMFRFNTLPFESLVVFSDLFPFSTLTSKPEQVTVLSHLFGFDTRVRTWFMVYYSSFFFNTMKTSVVDTTPIKRLKIFPNPASSWVNIQSDVKINRLYVMDIAGRIIHMKEVNDYVVQFSVHDFEDGLYLFRMETTNGWESRKIAIHNNSLQ